MMVNMLVSQLCSHSAPVFTAAGSEETHEATSVNKHSNITGQSDYGKPEVHLKDL